MSKPFATLTIPRLVLLGAFAAAVLVAVLYGIVAGRVHAPPESLKALAWAPSPQAVPSVAFEDAAGKRHSLAEFKGRTVLLNLWATWCAPCVRELPALASLEGTMPAGKFTVVAVDVGRGTAADARDFLAGHGAGALTAYIDTNSAFMRAFGAFGLPLSILIDAQGREIARALGPAQWDDPAAIAYLKTKTR